MPPTFSWRQIYRDAYEASDDLAETIDRLNARARELAQTFAAARRAERRQIREDMVATGHAIEFATKKFTEQQRLMKSRCVTPLALNVADLRKDGAPCGLIVASLARLAAETAQLDKKHGAALLEMSAALLADEARRLRQGRRKPVPAGKVVWFDPSDRKKRRTR